jgi:hypothetical protein
VPDMPRARLWRLLQVSAALPAPPIPNVPQTPHRRLLGVGSRMCWAGCSTHPMRAASPSVLSLAVVTSVKVGAVQPALCACPVPAGLPACSPDCPERVVTRQLLAHRRRARGSSVWDAEFGWCCEQHQPSLESQMTMEQKIPRQQAQPAGPNESAMSPRPRITQSERRHGGAASPKIIQ